MLKANQKMKQTPAGEIPVDWGSNILGDIAEVQGGIQKGRKAKDKAEPRRYLTVGHVSRGRIADDDARYIDVTSAEIARLRLIRDDLLLVEGNGNPDIVGRPTIYNKDWQDCVFQNHLIRVRSNPNLNQYYLYSFLSSQRGRYQIRNEVVSSSGLSTISVGRVRALHIPIPPLPEQKKIAEILSTWDDGLEKLDELIEAKEQQKRGLMQQLLTGKKRLPGFEGEWEFPKANDVFKSDSTKNKEGLPILSVTQDQGVVLRDSLERKINQDSGNYPNYKVVEPGDFVISLRSFQGGLEYSTIRGAVSPAYHVIRSVRPISDSYFKHYFKSYHFIGHLAVAVIGIRDGKQISFGDFSFLNLPYPEPREQQAIASILDAADEEIDLLQQKRDAREEQKRGLMQQLLTGKVRVKLEEVAV